MIGSAIREHGTKLGDSSVGVDFNLSGDPRIAHINHGKGYGAASFGNWFKKQCEAAGLSRCTAHGLGKAGATALAQAGATESEIAAFLGHASTREAARYTQAANRSRLTDPAMAKLSTEPERNLTNPSERLVKEGS